MKKTFKSYIGIWAILLVLFNVIAFVVPAIEGQDKYTASFWIGYIFITISFAGQLLCAKVAFEAKNLQKMLYNIPLISISYTGLLVSFITGGLCMIISALPYWVGVVVNMLVLAITAITIIKANIAADTVAELDKKIKVNTFFIKSLTVDAEGLVARANTDEIKAECKKIYEAVRYSDPMSDEALVTVESQITLKFVSLTEAVNEGNVQAVKDVAREVMVLLDDRNKKCRLLE